MKIQLIDRNQQMIDQWKFQFQNCEDVIIHHGDFFSLETDCVVSPANSFGFMDGGLDGVISETLGWQIESKLQKQIKEKYNGELLVGQAELVITDNKAVPYCISAPTMRVPLIISNTINVYLATKAVFVLLKKINAEQNVINSITISGFGTGVGELSYDVFAKQMKQAYDDFWLDKYVFPLGWFDAQQKHHKLNII